MKRFMILMLLLCVGAGAATAAEYDGRYGWPVQKRPRKVVVCPTSGLTSAEMMLLESLSGLAAQAVNEGRGDEMVWIETGNEEYKALFEASVGALRITGVRQMGVWELLAHLKKSGVLKGYVAYRADSSQGPLYSRRNGISCASNVATVYCGLLRGALIEESLVPRVRDAGLKCLKRVGDETMEECFDRNKALLNNTSALSIDPQVTNCRDIAIAQKLMLYYDTGTFSERVLEWVRPLSPILGWNCGHEDEYTGVITRWGHYNTATNWCWNLPLLMAASPAIPLSRQKDVVPDRIDWTDTSSCHAFLMSDGDNMQWTMGAFIRNPGFYGNPDGNRTPLSWTLCPVNLSVVSAATWNQLCDSKPAGSTFVEYGGGYQYPDEFAVLRPNRSELLREFARRLDWHFKRLNIQVFGFICKDVNSAAAKEAFEIYAQEMEHIAGMVAVQYYPYELGGNIIWVKNRAGIDIPVVTARFCIWEKTTDRPLCGTPDYIAALINRDAMAAAARGEQALSWTIINAWSGFDKESSYGVKPNYGYNVALNAGSLMLDKVRNIPLDELIWRIRMKYRPDQTRSQFSSR